MFCKNCGNFVADGEAFCGNCGLKVNHPAGYQPINTNTLRPVGAPKPPKKKSKKAVLLIIPVVVILVVVIAVVAVYKKAADTPLAKIMSAAGNMISSGDTYKITGSYNDGWARADFEGKIRTDTKNETMAINDFIFEESYRSSSRSKSSTELAFYCSVPDEIIAFEGRNSSEEIYLYNRYFAEYDKDDSKPYDYDTNTMNKSMYRFMTEAASTIFSLLNSDFYSDADDIAANLEQFLEDNDRALQEMGFNITLKSNFSDSLKQFMQDISQEEFQKEVLGLQVTDNNEYLFEIDIEYALEKLCDYFDSTFRINGYSLEDLIDWDDLPEETIELTVQMDKKTIQSVDIYMEFEEGYFVEIELSFEKTDENVTVDTDVIQDKAKR